MRKLTKENTGLFKVKDFSVGDEVEYKQRIVHKEEWLKGVVTKVDNRWGITIEFPEHPIMNTIRIPPRFLYSDYLRKIDSNKSSKEKVLTDINKMNHTMKENYSGDYEKVPDYDEKEFETWWNDEEEWKDYHHKAPKFIQNIAKEFEKELKDWGGEPILMDTEESGPIYVNVNVDRGVIETGGVANVGFLRGEYEIPINPHEDLVWHLEELRQDILENEHEYDDDDSFNETLKHWANKIYKNHSMCDMAEELEDDIVHESSHSHEELEHASKEKLIEYVGEEIKNLKDSADECLKRIAYRFNGAYSGKHAEMLDKYDELRLLIDDMKRKLVSSVYDIVG